MSRTLSLTSPPRIADAGGGMKLGLGVAITSSRSLGGGISQPQTPTVLNTRANSTTVYANANGFKAAMLNIEQQLTALGA